MVAGRYRLEQPLARGGMGSVWVARHLQLESQVAIKFMDAAVADSPTARARFEREAKAAAQIHSPHVVTIHDYGVASGTPFLVMELLEGEDLGARIRNEGPLPPEVVSGIVTHVARALRLAHEAGIVHRDLKPGNVFLTINVDTEIAKVLDFGIAKTRGLQQQPLDPDEATRTDQILGSPQYMSPEQVKASRDVDHRSDLWSLAVIAYRALTAHLPFSSNSVADVLVKICSEPAPPPSTYRPELPSQVDRFFVRALAKDPDLRFQTASELAAAFTEAVETSFSGDGATLHPKKSARRMGGRTIPARPSSPGAWTAAEAPLVALARREADAPTVPEGRSSSPDDFPEEAGPESTTVPFRRSLTSSPGERAGAPELLGGMTPHQLSVSSDDFTTRKPPPPAPSSASVAASIAPPARARPRGLLIGGGIGLTAAIATVLAARLLGGGPRVAPPAASASPVEVSVERHPASAPRPAEVSPPAPPSAAPSAAQPAPSEEPVQAPIPAATVSAAVVHGRPSSRPGGGPARSKPPAGAGSSKVPNPLKEM